MKINLNKNTLARRFVLDAIGEQFYLMDKFDHNREGEHDIVLTVDGVELNFLNIINKIDKIYDEAVTQAAGKMYVEQIDSRSDEIAEELDEILERLKYIRNNKFPEINWRD